MVNEDSVPKNCRNNYTKCIICDFRPLKEEQWYYKQGIHAKKEAESNKLILLSDIKMK